MALHVAGVLRSERRRGADLAAELGSERARQLRYGDVNPATGFVRFEAFQARLLLELKRARRYRYPLAAGLVAVNPGNLAPAERAPLHAHVAECVREVVRDVDLPVHYADGRFLVFLPYTDATGGEPALPQLAELAADLLDIPLVIARGQRQGRG